MKTGTKVKIKLAAMNYLEFAVWGAYLTSLGTFLWNKGMEGSIGIFYAIQGIVSLFMPAVIGIIADKYIQAQRMLSLCHFIAGAFMIGAGFYALTAGDNLQFGPLFILYTISVGFYMPTIGLANSIAYTTLNKYNLDTIKHFPPIRVFGTVGFICAMLFVNFTGFQNTYNQLFTSGVLSLILAFYAVTLTKCPVNKSSGKKSLVQALGLDAFKLFKSRQMALFFIFSMLLGVSLQITNGFANPFIKGFAEIPEYASTWGANNANALISLSQMSETLCILLIPFFLRRYGIKIVMAMSMFAWVFRFGFFGIGNPGDGVWLFILSMIVYGIAFDFFNVSGSLYVDRNTNPSMRSSAQGLFMIMTNGLGATIGVLGAQAVIDHFVTSASTATDKVNGWHTSWFIFAAYALIVGLLFLVLFKYKHTPEKETVPENIVEEDIDDPEGLIK